MPRSQFIICITYMARKMVTHRLELAYRSGVSHVPQLVFLDPHCSCSSSSHHLPARLPDMKTAIFSFSPGILLSMAWVGR